VDDPRRGALEADVPVHCVERGRWAYRSQRFAPAAHAAAPELRRHKGQAEAWAEGVGEVGPARDRLADSRRGSQPGSALFQRRFSGRSQYRAVFAPPENSPQSTAAGAPTSRKAGRAESTSGTAVAVPLVPRPERRNDEAQQQLELGVSEGSVARWRSVRPIRWVP